jgi:hypothetical protein
MLLEDLVVLMGGGGWKLCKMIVKGRSLFRSWVLFSTNSIMNFIKDFILGLGAYYVVHMYKEVFMPE